MKKVTLLVMVLMVLSKIFGFGREVILSFFYGASSYSDAYIIATTIPGVIFGFIASGFSLGYIPIYNKVLVEKGKNEALRYTNNVINILLVISTVIIILGVIFTEPIVKIFASGFRHETLELTINLTRVSITAIYFTAIVYIISSYLQVKGSFIVAGLIGVPLNLLIIFSIALSKSYGANLLSYGFVIASASQLLILIPILKKKEYKYKFIIDIKSKYLTSLLYISIPLILGFSVNQINLLVDRTIASQLEVGGISALNYSSKLNAFVQGIFVLPITTVIYPTLSQLSASKEYVKFKSVINQSILGICFFIIPSIVGFIVFSSQIISLLFGRGAFDMDALFLTSGTLSMYSIGMIGIGLRDILSRSFYVLEDSKTPMKNSVIGVILNIFLNIVLSKIMGIRGLALATSIAATFTTVLLFISLRKKIGPFGMKQISISFLKILFASLVMGGLAKLSFNYLTASLSQNLSLLIAIGVGAVSYFVIIYFMKIEDVDVIVGEIKKKLGRGAA
ncbi:murein biosynthesis integral membrane protein MurJ [Acetoanaerobium noterae]|uniref:murein biosynthesis integral membrane protein MurJ n=1 Tax=Acetoanaerobium noterae TaxID=745369 RepID=UPI0032216A93